MGQLNKYNGVMHLFIIISHIDHLPFAMKYTFHNRKLITSRVFVAPGPETVVTYLV